MLSEDDRETALRVADAVHDHPLAEALLTNGGWPEATALWTLDLEVDTDGDENEGAHSLQCKGRVDYYDPRNGVLADLKTSRDASPDAFTRASWKPFLRCL